MHFFRSQHDEVCIDYVGHAENRDRLEPGSDPAELDSTVSRRRDGRLIAQASVHCDRQSLETEAAMEHESQPERRYT